MICQKSSEEHSPSEIHNKHKPVLLLPHEQGEWSQWECTIQKCNVKQ